MGCLNSTGQFAHWFGNIHLSGLCNRSCYFCIGQHMMALDPLDVMDTWPLPGIDRFVDECNRRGISEINVTGSNTDPLLYKRTWRLRAYLGETIPGLVMKIRTNGAKPSADLRYYDGGSVTCCSMTPDIYRAMMGQGHPPNWDELGQWMGHWRHAPKVNIVLGPENTVENANGVIDWCETIAHIEDATRDWVNGGIKRFNLREPYGQPRVGNPFDLSDPWMLGVTERVEDRLGMPTYRVWGDILVTYWDVHYCEVESVNLYANGNVSIDYPISRGHDPATGKVLDQTHWQHGRHTEQWVTLRRPKKELV